LSNFPAFLVGQGVFPTVGFRLDDFLPPEEIADPFSYLKALLLTMTDAHDKLRDVPDNFKTYPIYTAEIPSTKFDLQDRDVTTLFKLGEGVGLSVDWQKYSAEKPEISYYDPKPQKALQMSLRQAYELWESFANKNMWLDALKHDTTFSVYIEKDWSSRYERLGEVSVAGARPLFVSQFRLSGVAPDLGSTLSLSDCQYTAEEVHANGARTPLISIPAFNGVDTKGFLLFLRLRWLQARRERITLSSRFRASSLQRWRRDNRIGCTTPRGVWHRIIKSNCCSGFLWISPCLC
jgi:hypothetical protein